MTDFHLAQFNIARAMAPMDDPVMAEFVAKLNKINALADQAPGFVWRLQDDSGNATTIQAFDDPRLLINMSVWTSVDALFDYVYKSGHAAVMARRKEWFERFGDRHMVLWWVPAGHIPNLGEAKKKLGSLQTLGPTVHAFTFKQRFTAPAGKSGEAA
ncbi:MAG: DUF3291 domain-containing protein [Alphaproteobacteria bacterium]|nr:DUF3291 domain-containing protein [Alphaproteobacteria bacterium]